MRLCGRLGQAGLVTALVCGVILSIPYHEDLRRRHIFTEDNNPAPVVRPYNFINESGLMMDLRGLKLIINAAHHRRSDVLRSVKVTDSSWFKGYAAAMVHSIKRVIWEKHNVRRLVLLGCGIYLCGHA